MTDDRPKRIDLSDDERELLKHLSKDINRTAYHGGIGERAERYLGLLDKLIGEPGWELRFPSAGELGKSDSLGIENPGYAAFLKAFDETRGDA